MVAVLSARYCGLDKAIALLKEQYAVGTLEIKIVKLSPSMVN